MRRPEKEIKDRAQIEAILHRAQVCRIAMCQDDIPYIVPMSFGYRDNCLYFHSASVGKKIGILRRNNRVCFELDVDQEHVDSLIPSECTTRYRSVIGFGRAAFVTDPAEKKRALDLLMQHYADPQSQTYEYSEKPFSKVTIIKVEIESMTGKQSGY